MRQSTGPVSVVSTAAVSLSRMVTSASASVTSLRLTSPSLMFILLGFSFSKPIWPFI